MPSPPNPDRNRTQVSSDVVALPVHVAKLPVNLKIPLHLTRNPAAEVNAKFILALLQKLSAQRYAAIEATPPPCVERIASRARNVGRRIQLPRAMVKALSNHKVSCVFLGHRNVEDRIEQKAVDVITRPRRLRGLQRRSAERKVSPQEVQPEAEVFAVIARHASPSHATAALYEGSGRAARKVRATTNVERPILIVMRTRFSPRSGFVLGSFGARCGGLLPCRGLLRVGCRSHEQQQYKNRRELSNHSLSSRYRAWLRTIALGIERRWQKNTSAV